MHCMVTFNQPITTGVPHAIIKFSPGYKSTHSGEKLVIYFPVKNYVLYMQSEQNVFSS